MPAEKNAHNDCALEKITCGVSAEDIESMLEAYRTEYTAGDKLSLLKAVSFSWKTSRPLPSWVHEILSENFDRYLELEGKEYLASIFGLKWGRGRTQSPFSKKNQTSQADHIVGEMQTLHNFLGFTLPVSALILQKKGVLFPKTNGEPGSVHLSANTILDLYKKSEKLTPEETTRIYGESKDEKIDYFFEEYASTFSALHEKGIFHKEGLLDSAKKSLSALLT